MEDGSGNNLVSKHDNISAFDAARRMSGEHTVHLTLAGGLTHIWNAVLFSTKNKNGWKRERMK